MDEDHNSRLARIEAILPTLATKADLESLRGDIARWMFVTAVGFFVGLSGLIFAAANMLTRPEATAQPAATMQCQPCAPPQAALPQEKSPR
jgi:hypothetical protein